MDFAVRLERSAKTWFLCAVFLFLYFLNVFWHPGAFLDGVGQPTSVQPPREQSNATHWNASWRMATLVDRHDFRFLLNSQRCDSAPSLFMLIFVHSAPNHADRRRAIRQTWGREGAAGEEVRVVFLVGVPATAALQADIVEESARHGDMVQGNFLDTYKNLTYKHVMGLKWVSHFCRHAQYVFKADDDIFVDTAQVVDYLKRVFVGAPPTDLMMCVLYERPYVKRSHRSKWYVAVKEYADNYYPSYCAGWTIIMSAEVAFNLYLESTAVPYFWVDDVVVSGILAHRLGIQHVQLNDKIPDSLTTFTRWLSRRRADARTGSPFFALAEIDVETIYSLWNKTMQYYSSLNSSPHQ